MDDDPQSTTQERVSIIISIETVHGEMYSIQHYMMKFPSELKKSQSQKIQKHNQHWTQDTERRHPKQKAQHRQLSRHHKQTEMNPCAHER